MPKRLSVALAILLGFSCGLLHATPITPISDDEVIEVLPAWSANRREERRLREQLVQQPRNAVLALATARRYLAQAHETGDPRFAGMALAAVAAWNEDATTPSDILLTRANVQQYLHEFDAAAATLQLLLRRPGPPQAQAWLTLATVRRVQGRYAESDSACQQVARAGAGLYANACLAENAGLRGDVSRARAAFTGLIAAAPQATDTRNWLTTSLAELEQRAGNATAAERAFRSALRLESDAYTILSYCDFLIEQQRPTQALALLHGQVRSDAVLLRLAIAGSQSHAASATVDVAELRARIALANERPDAKLTHGREQAMFALLIDRDAARALDLARGNVARQREPLDLLVYAQAAVASGKPAARLEAKNLAQELGLVDQRVNRLL